MEERAPPLAAAIHPLPTAITTTTASETPPPRRAPSSHYNNVPQQVPFQPRKISRDAPSFSFNVQPKTYIVQIPKDQIFSVPPPEHAKIVERYREEKNSGKGSAGNGCCSSRCLAYTLCFFILIGAIIGASIGIKRALIKPKLPIIKIKSFNVKRNGGKLPQFDVVVMVKNDGRMRISPDGNGDASLMYKTIEIESGRIPGLRVGSGGSKSISLRLKASKKRKLPKAVKASVADKKGKKPISVELVMRIPVVMSASGVKSQSKEIDVNCKLRVRSLGSNKGIMSQKCVLNFL
ncbi:NDR1/HIN1-like protein 13 [Linum grandiflorum]